MWNRELSDVQAAFRKGRGPEIKLPTSVESWKKQERSRKTSTSALLTTAKPLTVWITTDCGKLLKRWEYQSTLPASWEICMQVKKQLLEPAWNNGPVPNWERSSQGYVLSPCLFKFFAEDIMRNAGLDESQAEIKIAERNVNSLRYADDTTLMAESEETLRASWWKWKRRVKKLA